VVGGRGEGTHTVTDEIPQPVVHRRSDYPVELLLIRHGESAQVVPGTEAAHDPPLSPTGRSEAAALASRLSGKVLDSVWSSDLSRAVETADALLGGRDMKLKVNAALREVHLGDWSGGLFRKKAFERDLEFLEFVATGRWDEIPGSEGDLAFQSRIRQAVDNCLTVGRPATVAVIAHSGVINTYLASILDSPRSIIFEIANASISLVRCGPHGRRLIETINDCRHLPDPLF
jgi:probable phosphoglycerate mutase